MQGDCLSGLRRAYNESSRDFNELLRMDLISKKRLFAEMEGLYNSMQSNCGESLSSQVLQSGLANIKLAQLKVALALKKDIQGKTINDSDISRIISKFTDDEFDSMEKLDRFSKIDSLNSESITTLLMNKDDQIYRLIKEWYEDNMEDFLASIDLLSGKNVRGEISKGMEEKYRTRFDKLSEGIIGYIQKDPGQIRKMFVNYENAIKRAMNIENRRVEVERELRELLSSQELLRLNDEFKSVLALAQSGNVDELRKKDIDSMIKGFNDFNIKIKGKISEVESEIGKMETDFEMKANPFLKDIEKKRLEALVEEANSSYPNSVLTPLNSLQTIKELTIALSGGASKSFDTSYSVSEDQARLRRDSFFESVLISLSRQENISFFVPLFSANVNIRKKDMARKLREMEQSSSGKVQSVGKEMMAYFNIPRIFRPDIRFALDLAFLGHDETFQSTSRAGIGIDQTPVNIRDVSEHYSKLLLSASDLNMYIISIIGSPNGFSPDVIKYVQNESNSGLSGRTVSLILKDTRDGNIYYDKNDPTSAEVVKILTGSEDKSEKNYKAVKEATMAECSITGITRSKTICMVTSLPEDDVIIAWKRMEKEGLGKSDSVNGENVFRVATKNM